MLATKQKLACSEKHLLIRKDDLPLSCPMDSMELWNAHPKVYLAITTTKKAICPYCGTRFVLQNA